MKSINIMCSDLRMTKEGLQCSKEGTTCNPILCKMASVLSLNAENIIVRKAG